VKKVVLVIVVLFIGFYLLTQPVAFADFAGDAFTTVWDLATEFFEAVIAFLNALVS